MTTKLYGFHGATDLGSVRNAMTRFLATPGACRPVALFYGRPTCRVMKDVVLPDIEYFHFRTRNDVECFCMGYVSFEGELYTPTSDPAHDMFQAEAFADAIREMEEHTAWKYGGQTELILLNAYRAPRTDSASLDFTTVISFCLEEAEKTGAIQSAGEFLESFFRFAINYKGTNFTYDFSDHLGLREAASSLKTVWFKILPKPLRDGAQHALNWYVKDFSSVEVAAAALKFINEPDEAILEEFPADLGRRVVKQKHLILEGDG
jgi:hypothetical protein